MTDLRFVTDCSGRLSSGSENIMANMRSTRCEVTHPNHTIITYSHDKMLTDDNAGKHFNTRL